MPTTTSPAIAKAAPALMYRLFDLRVGLRAQSAPLRDARADDARGDARLSRRLPRAALRLRHAGRDRERHTRVVGEGGYLLRGFTGRDNNTLINYAYYRNGAPLPFQSGDVILVRGHAHNSAAIARIGDVDSQFSHVGIVYIDEAGDHWMVESLIEDGAIINPLAKALDHGIVRAVLYRNRDRDLAGAGCQVHFRLRRGVASQGRQAHPL